MSQQYFDAEGRPINQFGTPSGAPPAAAPTPAGGPYPPGPPYQPGQPAQPGFVAPPPPYAGRVPPKPGLPTAAKVAIALGSTAAGLVILGILAAIAIPVFLDQRAKAAADGISIALPAQVAGYPRMTGAPDAQVQGLVAGLPAEARGASQGAAYGVGHPSVIVIAGRHVMLGSDQSDFLTGVAKAEARDGVIQLPVDPGPLGGRMQCGAAIDGSRTDCAFADAGAFGVIDVAVTGTDALSLAQQIRSAIETHRGRS